MDNDELEKLVKSNAKAIQALAEQKLELEKMLCTAMLMCANAQAIMAKCYFKQHGEIDVTHN